MKHIRANDYINTMRNYLKNYNYYMQYLSNARETVKDIDRQLATESIKVSRYGNEAGGGSSDGLTLVEKSASLRIKLEREKQDLLSSSLAIESLMTRITNTMQRLSPEEQRIVREFYIEEQTYESMARTHICSPRWCRKRLRLAEEKMALMMFGPRAADSIRFIETGA